MPSSPSIDRRRLLALGGMAFTTLAGLAGCGGGGDDGGSAGGGTGGTGGTGGGGSTGGGGGGGTGGGGTGGGGGNPGAGTPGTAVSTAQRVAALDAVAAEVTALIGTGMRFDSAALVQRLQAMPVFQSVGVSDRMQNVWALFTDGRALVVPNNLDPLPVAATPAPMAPARAAQRRERALGAAAGEDLPALLCDQQYRQIDTFGVVPLIGDSATDHLCGNTIDASTLPNLRALAEGRGFLRTPQLQAALMPDAGEDNGIEGLRAISGDGVFFLNGTAAELMAANGAFMAAFCTATPFDAAAEARYADELRSSTMVYAVTWVGAGDSWVAMPRLAITREFVFQNRWSFPANCIGILNVTGGSSFFNDWASALSSAGLRNVFYWKQALSVKRAISFADDLLQLLLASNRIWSGGFGPRFGVHWPPRLRTHGFGETVQFLVGAGLANDLQDTSQAQWIPEPNPAGYVNTLLPTIDYALIREGTREMELIGQFGAARGALDVGGDPAVTFGQQFGSFQQPGRLLSDRALAMVREAADPPLEGDQLPQRGWKGDVITLDAARLPLRGGYVQVRNAGRVSNALPITYWKIPVHIVHEIDGALRTDCTIELHLRADVSPHRMRPEQRPGEAKTIVPLASMFESNARFTASGELSDTEGNVTTTLTWSGGSGAGNPAPGQHEIGCAGLMQREQRRASVTITGGTGTCLQREVKRRGTELLSDVTGPLPVTAVAVPRPEAALEFVFGERWELLAGGQASVVDTTFLLGKQRTQTTTVRWDAVAPECPPRDDFGGV